MRILHTVESYLPLQHGMSEVVRQISEYLVKKGHEVVVATSYCKQRYVCQINGVEIKSFKISGNFVNGYCGEIEEYKKYILNSKFDVISNFAAQQWATDLCFELLPHIKAKKYFIPTGFSKLKDNEYSTYFNKMKIWMQYYDLNIFLSSNYRDVQFAKDAGIKKIDLIPNGASYSEFMKNHSNFSIRHFLKLKSSTKIILHIGSYTGLKGHDDALKIYLKTKQKDTALIFVGENFEIGEGYYFKKKIKWFNTPYDKNKSRKKLLSCFFYFLKHLFISKLNRVYILSLERQHLVETFKQSDLFLFPSQIECSPVVLFEACAAKTPFIVTNVGNSEEIISWTGGGIVMPTYIDKFGYSRPYISESAKIISEMLENPQLMTSLSDNGFKNWIESYTWEKIAEKYEKTYLN